MAALQWRDRFNLRNFSFPFVGASAALIVGVSLLMAVWIAIVDDPLGGEPIVQVAVVEPKFDNAERNVGLIEVTSPERDEGSPPALTEVTGNEPQEFEPLNPDDILIYDPTADAVNSATTSLSSVADRNLIENSRHGFLPVVGANGQTPLIAYSRPSRISGGRTNRIALIVGGLGLNEKTTQRAIANLPGTTTLAFAPYANDLFDWMARARTAGHELLLQLPLEPFDYPNNDPGPRTLLVDSTWEENRNHLHWLLSRMTNYVGVMNFMGARFSASPEVLTPLFGELRNRGLMYVDDGSTPLSRAPEIAENTNTAFTQSTLVLDTVLTPEDIDARLLELESLARQKGLAIGVASAFPVTIDRLERWVKDAERRGIRLIPVSATLDKTSF